MKSLQELQVLRDQLKDQLGIGGGELKEIRIVVGMATCGIAAGAKPLFSAITEEAEKLGLANLTIVQTGCIGICQFEPVIEVYAPGREKTTYVHMDSEKAIRVIADHVVGGSPVTEYTIGASIAASSIAT